MTKIIDLLNNFILKFYFFNALLISSIVAFIWINFLMSWTLAFTEMVWNYHEPLNVTFSKFIILWLMVFILFLYLIFNILIIFFNKKFNKLNYIFYIFWLITKYFFLLLLTFFILHSLLLIIISFFYDIYKTIIFIKYKKNNKLNIIVWELKYIKILYLALLTIFLTFSFFLWTKPDNLVEIDDSYFKKIDNKFILDKENNWFYYYDDNVKDLEIESFNDIVIIRKCLLYKEQDKGLDYNSYEAFIERTWWINNKIDFLNKCNERFFSINEWINNEINILKKNSKIKLPNKILTKKDFYLKSENEYIYLLNKLENNAENTKKELGILKNATIEDYGEDLSLLIENENINYLEIKNDIDKLKNERNNLNLDTLYDNYINEFDNDLIKLMDRKEKLTNMYLNTFTKQKYLNSIGFDITLINDLDDKLLLIKDVSTYNYFYYNDTYENWLNLKNIIALSRLSLYHSLYYINKWDIDKAIDIQNEYLKVSKLFLNSNEFMTRLVWYTNTKIILDNIDFIYNNYKIDNLNKKIIRNNSLFLLNDSDIMGSFYNVLYFDTIKMYSVDDIYYINNFFFNYNLLKDINKNYFVYLMNWDDINANKIKDFLEEYQEKSFNIFRRNYFTYNSIDFLYESQIRKMKYLLKYKNEIFENLKKD